MAELVWDQVGERFYQTGADRGVLAFQDGTIVVWNGITGIDEGTDSERKSFYLDGVKFLEHVSPGDFVGNLRAFTYPDEFDRALGVQELIDGLAVHEQPPESFNLSYRTKIGNDLNEDFGYKIHLLYNLLVIPDNHTFESAREEASIGEFGWAISGVPATVYQKRSTTQITINSSKADPASLQALEDALYGTASTDPHFPSILEVRQLFGELGGLSITVNPDGSWTANDPSDDFITLVGGDPTHFQIANANAVYLSETSYQIQDTPIPIPPIE